MDNIKRITVTSGGVFEILCADCLRDEPFPEEIKVIGKATGWTERIKQKADARKLNIEISITKKRRKRR